MIGYYSYPRLNKYKVFQHTKKLSLSMQAKPNWDYMLQTLVVCNYTVL